MDYFNRFLQTIRVKPNDEELGNRAAVYPPDGRRSYGGYRPDEYPVEQNLKLKEFRLLVGIITHGSYEAPKGFKGNQRPIVTKDSRPAPNMGIYATVVDNEIKQKKQYKRFSWGINSCLGLQIIVAAALTALGAADGSRKAVTVFGAINTVIAGFLTYLKGSGLPGRLQYFQHEWTKVREYIEQRERDLTVSDNDVDVVEEVRYIRFMFENVREDIESNRPDRFVGLGGPRKNHLSAGPANLALPAGSMPALSRMNTVQGRMNSGLSEGLYKMKEKADGLHEKTEAYGSAATSEVNHMRTTLTDDLGQLKSRLRSKMSEIEGLEKDIALHGQRFVESREAELRKGAEDKIEEVGDRERDLEAYGHKAVQKKEHEVTVRATDAVVDAAGRIQTTLEVRDPFGEEKRDT